MTNPTHQHNVTIASEQDNSTIETGSSFTGRYIVSYLVFGQKGSYSFD